MKYALLLLATIAFGQDNIYLRHYNSTRFRSAADSTISLKIYRPTQLTVENFVQLWNEYDKSLKEIYRERFEEKLWFIKNFKTAVITWDKDGTIVFEYKIGGQPQVDTIEPQEPTFSGFMEYVRKRFSGKK